MFWAIAHVTGCCDFCLLRWVDQSHQQRSIDLATEILTLAPPLASQRSYPTCLRQRLYILNNLNTGRMVKERNTLLRKGSTATFNTLPEIRCGSEYRGTLNKFCAILRLAESEDRHSFYHIHAKQWIFVHLLIVCTFRSFSSLYIDFSSVHLIVGENVNYWWYAYFSSFYDSIRYLKSPTFVK